MYDENNRNRQMDRQIDKLTVQQAKNEPDEQVDRYKSTDGQLNRQTKIARWIDASTDKWTIGQLNRQPKMVRWTDGQMDS
jgi:hypothetical protein